MKSENNQLEKQVEVLSTTTEDIKSGETTLQQAISEKNKAFLQLRDGFDEVIAQKDNVVNTLRAKLDELRADYLQSKQEQSSGVNEEEFAELARQVAETTKQRDWLKGELERVIAEKEDLGGSMRKRFDSISTGLREDLENAFKDREDYENEFEIHRLQLEQKVKNQSDELSDLHNTVSEKDRAIEEKSTLISMLEGRVEKAADILSKEKYFENLEQRLRESDQNVSTLSKEKEELESKFDSLNHQYENMKVELDLAVAEKNQLKLSGDGIVEEIQLKKAEEFQNLRSTFETTMEEKEKILSNLQKKLTNYDADKDEEMRAVKKALKDEFANIEGGYQEKLTDLENQLQNLLNEKEEKVQQVMLTAEKDRTQQLAALQGDLNTLLNAKEDKIKSLSSQFANSQQELTKKEEEKTALQKAVQKLDEEKGAATVQIDQLRSACQALQRSKESEIEQVIINKGKGLKDLRNEFESVFNEKNKIIEDMRNKMKELRKDVSNAHHETREKTENARELEQMMTEIETGKIEMEAKTSLLSDTVDELKKELDSMKKEKTEQSKYIEQLMQENSNLMSSLDVSQHQQPSQIAETDEQSGDSLAHKQVLENIKGIVSNVPGLNMNDSVNDLHEDVRKLVQMLDEAQNQEEVNSNASPVIETPSNDEDSKEEAGLKSDVLTLQRRLTQMQNEVMTLTAEKENSESIVHEKYEDILGNLREDLTQARQGYHSLQEENFALKNQLDVFTNVDAKRMQSSPVSKQRPQFMSELPPLPIMPPKVKSILPEELQQSFAAPQDSFLEQSFDTSPIKDNVRLEFIEPVVTAVQESELEASNVDDPKTSTGDSSHKNVVKLKKLCRKYKDNLHESQEENTALQKELGTAKHNLRAAVEHTNQEKMRYEREIQTLREEIDGLVVDKSSLVDHFKSRNEEDAAENRQNLFDLQADHQRKIQLLNDKMDGCLHELNTRDSVIEQQLLEKADGDRHSKQLEDLLQQRDAEVQQLSENTCNLQTSYEEQSRVLAGKDSTIENLQNEIADLSKSLDHLKDEMKPKDTCSVQLDNPRFDEYVIESYRKDNSEYKSQVMEMMSEREQAMETLNILTQRAENLESHIEKLNAEKLMSESSVKSLRDDVSGFVKEKEDIVKQWKNRLQQSEVDHMRTEHDLRSEIETLTNELAAAHGQISLLDDSVQDQKEQLQQFEARGQAQGDSLTDLALNLSKSNKECDKLQKTLEASRMEVVALNKRIENKNEELVAALDRSKEHESVFQKNKETIESQTLQLSQLSRDNESLRNHVDSLKNEKEELENRLRREVQQAYDDLASQNSKLRTETFNKEKSLQDLRRELGTLVREKEFLQTAMRGQLATSGATSSNDTEYLRFQVQQLRREKDETNDNFDKMTDDMRAKLEDTSKEKDAVSLRMATLRAMLEQEVKDHEKTKFLKEQLSNSRGVSLDKLKLSVTGMKDNLRSLKKDMDTNMTGIRGACQEFVLNIAPTMLKAQQQQQQPTQQSLDTSTTTQQQVGNEETGLLKLQLGDKKKQLDEAWAKIKGLQTSNRIADSRLRDLVEVLQELGSIQTVQVCICCEYFIRILYEVNFPGSRDLYEDIVA